MHLIYRSLSSIEPKAFGYFGFTSFHEYLETGRLYEVFGGLFDASFVLSYVLARGDDSLVK